MFKRSSENLKPNSHISFSLLRGGQGRVKYISSFSASLYFEMMHPSQALNQLYLSVRVCDCAKIHHSSKSQIKPLQLLQV